MFHLIAPLLIGIYVGILVGPPLRVWGASRDWEWQARGGYVSSEEGSYTGVTQTESRIPDLEWFDDPVGDQP